MPMRAQHWRRQEKLDRQRKRRNASRVPLFVAIGAVVAIAICLVWYWLVIKWQARCPEELFGCRPINEPRPDTLWQTVIIGAGCTMSPIAGGIIIRRGAFVPRSDYLLASTFGCVGVILIILPIYGYMMMSLLYS